LFAFPFVGEDLDEGTASTSPPKSSYIKGEGRPWA
jgi:hypothetical protein